MQNLIKQTRGRFSGKTQESISFKDRRRAQSFKEAKRGQNWFQRQFSGQMNRSYDFDNGIEQTVAVAAAAYVINSIEESSIRDQKKIGQGSIRSTKHADSKVPITIAPEEKGPEKAVGSAPSIKKTITFSDRQLERTDSFISRYPSKLDSPSIKPISPDITTIKPEATKADMSTIKNGSAATRADISTAEPESARKKKKMPRADSPVHEVDISATKPDQPQTIKRGTQSTETKTHSSSRPATGETVADTWERAEMAKIKERYEKLDSTILEWEIKKKTKATNKLHKTEGELELRRAKALKKFQKEMEYIKQVAEGARAQAKEKRRNDELKAKEKANIIRTTGKVPRTCFCL